MAITIKNSSEDLYKNSKDYTPKTVEKGVVHKGVTYHQKITYEQKLGIISRVAMGALALIATLTVLPLLFNQEKIVLWWQQAITGIDQKIVLIQEKEKAPPKQVNFGEARARIFNHDLPSEAIGDMHSVEFTPKTGSAPQPSSLMPQAAIGSQKRRIPPVSAFDTVVGGKSVHGSGELFTDVEITEKLDITKTSEIAPNSRIYAAYTSHGKAIIQQQATRGCTAATAAMLIMDHGKQPDVTQLLTRNLGNSEDQIDDIQHAGLTAIKSSASTLGELRDLIMKNGSSVVSLSGRLGGHVVVVDEVSRDLSNVRLRDPYHGWEITVTATAFLKEWSKGEIIQASRTRY